MSNQGRQFSLGKQVKTELAPRNQFKMTAYCSYQSQQCTCITRINTLSPSQGWNSRLVRGLYAGGSKFRSSDLTSLLRLLSVLRSLSSSQFP